MSDSGKQNTDFSNLSSPQDDERLSLSSVREAIDDGKLKKNGQLTKPDTTLIFPRKRSPISYFLTVGS